MRTPAIDRTKWDALLARAVGDPSAGHGAVRDTPERSPEQATPPADEDGRAAETPFDPTLEARRP